MTDPDIRELRITFEGPPVSREMQQMFGPYAHEAVTGVAVLPEGLQVAYADGSQWTFYAVPSGKTLVACPDGHLRVR